MFFFRIVDSVLIVVLKFAVILNAVGCVLQDCESCCDWCYCAGWPISVKFHPRKFRARPNLITFTRVMALVCRVVVSRHIVDTESLRSQPFLYCEQLQLDVFESTKTSSLARHQCSL